MQRSLFSVVLLIASTLGTAVDAASPAGDALEAYRAAARDAGAGGLDREATEGWIGRLSDAAARNVSMTLRHLRDEISVAL